MKICWGPAWGLKPIWTMRVAVWDISVRLSVWGSGLRGSGKQVNDGALLRFLIEVSQSSSVIPRGLRVEARATGDEDFRLRLVDDQAMDFRHAHDAATPAAGFFTFSARGTFPPAGR